MEIYTRHMRPNVIRPNIKDLGLLEKMLPHKAVRFVVTKTDRNGIECETDMIDNGDGIRNIFSFRRREYDKARGDFTCVLIIPTGVGADIGGHCGDAGALCRLLASACDNLITHPNVVNASDYNEIPDNTLYVEGSILTSLLMGTCGLRMVRSNKMLLIAEENPLDYINDEIVNAVSTARVTLGIHCDVLFLKSCALMVSETCESGRAVGRITLLERITDVLDDYVNDYDAFPITTLIGVQPDIHEQYFITNELDVNPWGGVEAMLTHALTLRYRKPFAHSPQMESEEVADMKFGIVDPRKAAETASLTFLHCILKGLHNAPQMTYNLDNAHFVAEDISCVIMPYGCVGLPFIAALEQNIPLILVKDKNIMHNEIHHYITDHEVYIAENYLEVIGYMNVIKSGVNIGSIERPIAETTIFKA